MSTRGFEGFILRKMPAQGPTEGIKLTSLRHTPAGQCEFDWTDLVGSVRAMHELTGWGRLFRTGISPHLYWFV